MRLWWTALGSFGAFVALSVSLRLRLVNTFDSMVRDWARPHDVWGTVQMEADLVVEGLRPAVLAALLAVFAAVCCVRRRSLRPAVFVAGVSVATVALTVATKAAVARPDPHGLIGPDGGQLSLRSHHRRFGQRGHSRATSSASPALDLDPRCPWWLSDGGLPLGSGGALVNRHCRWGSPRFYGTGFCGRVRLEPLVPRSRGYDPGFPWPNIYVTFRLRSLVRTRGNT
jgi:hypothetical protein